MPSTDSLASYFSLKILAFAPLIPSEFVVVLHWVGMDILWTTLLETRDKVPQRILQQHMWQTLPLKHCLSTLSNKTLIARLTH